MGAMHLGGRQKIATFAAGIAMMGGVGFVGAQWARPSAPLSVEPISGNVPPVDAAPKGAESAVAEPTPVESSKPKEVVVAMAGAVKKGGLYRLPLDSRIDDAIRAAGGAKADADLEAINLAAKAVDGDQIYVPHKKAEEPAKAEETTKVAEKYRGGAVRNDYAARPVEPVMPLPLGGSVGALRVSKAKATGPVSLNTGSEAQMETLPGVGPATAAKILEYRQQHGGFASVEEIQAVSGIGPKKFAQMKPFLKL